MAITIDWGTKVISVPKADMTLITSTPYDVYELDLDVFRLRLKELEASVEGMPFRHTHEHNTEVTISGTTLARVIEIVNGYTVTFEDDQYAVNLVGANSNIGDENILNLNQVSVRSFNSAGLIVVDRGNSSAIADAVWNADKTTYTNADSMGLALCELYQIHGLDINEPLTVTQAQMLVAAIDLTLGGDGVTLSTLTRQP